MLVEGEERYHLRSGEHVRFELDVEVHEAQDDFVFGIALSTPRGMAIWGTNTDLAGFEGDSLEAGSRRVSIDCPSLRLAPGEYTIDLAAHAEDGTPYDYRRRLASLSVTATDRGEGVYFPRHQWLFGDGVAWKKTPADPE